jgi:dipeptidyl aminopeptidase/acylaminoacyl peptidase
MTAAALLLPPYNDFFKVGVSSSGNHDNNVYNQNWSEQYHGLTEVIIAQQAAAANANGNRQGGPQNGQNANTVDTTITVTGGGRADTTFKIKIPANHELAANLKGRLLLTHGDMDNNVHPAGTIRLANALIRANKRFDLFMFPGQPHSYGPMQGYFNTMMMEYFAEHLLGDYYRGNATMH